MNYSQPYTETTPELDSLVRNTELHRGYGTILLLDSLVRNTELHRGYGTILLVEDESFLREVTCEILESAGYRVLKARTAAEAISVFDEYKTIVRLLLTDVVLPGQNGRDLATDLRSISPKLKIIFTSGYPENVVTRQGLQEDGMFHLPKPFSAQSLTRKVRQVLEQPATTNTNVQAASYDRAEDWA